MFSVEYGESIHDITLIYEDEVVKVEFGYDEILPWLSLDLQDHLTTMETKPTINSLVLKCHSPKSGSIQTTIKINNDLMQQIAKFRHEIKQRHNIFFSQLDRE
jgi:hypothetical protein